MARRLFVACSDANAAAVVDISATRSRVDGFIPTGWYPTAVRALPSARWWCSTARACAPTPTRRRPQPRQAARTACTQGVRQPRQYVGRMQTGTASWIEPLHRRAARRLDARQRSPTRPTATPSWTQPSPLPPIEHVIYIVKENRTYDQVLGDMKEGNGDPSLVLFGENVTPNLHKLAREFVLLDNFYVNADVSADGHNWSTAAIAPDYVQKLWPNSYAGRRKTLRLRRAGRRLAPSRRLSLDQRRTPPASPCATSATWSNNKPNAAPGEEQITGVRDPVLAKVTNRYYRGFDLDYPDVERAKVFLNELAEYEKSGEMPRLIVMRLGNDHTSGTARRQDRAALLRRRQRLRARA